MTAVVLEPHPDDCALFACFLALRHQAKIVTVLAPNRMAGLGYPGGPVPTGQRLEEHRQAMAELGAEWEAWHFDDFSPNTDAIADRLVALDCDPLIAPAVEEDGHPDHNLVGSLAQIHGAELIQYTTYTRAGGRSSSAHEVPFEPGWPVLKLRALACYESQIAHPATQPWFLDGIREWVA